MKTKRGLDVDNVWVIFKRVPDSGMGNVVYGTTEPQKTKYLSLYTTKAQADLFLESVKALGHDDYVALISPGAAGLLELLERSQREKVEHFTFNAMPATNLSMYRMQEIIDDVRDALGGG
jgi:hypothetical protein